MNRAQTVEARMLSQYMTTGTPIAFPATSMNQESVTQDFYNLPLRYDECTSEDMLWAYGSEDYLSPH